MAYIDKGCIIIVDMAYEEQQRAPEPNESYPFLDRWVNLGLKAEYPFIEPNSEIGQLGLRIYEDAETANQRQEEMYAAQANGWQIAAHDCQLAEERRTVFRNMAHHLDRLHTDGAKPDASRKLLYISEASKQAEERIRVSDRLSLTEKDGLLSLINTLGYEYWAEDCHFLPKED